jgi:hypothetical protein
MHYNTLMKTSVKLILMLLITSLFTAGCSKSTTGQPYATQKDNAWSRNACGAFSMAYYLAETNQISGADVEKTAKKIYKKIKFDPSAGFGDYSDPFKIIRESAQYADSVSLKMNLSNPKEPGEKLMEMLFNVVRAKASQIKNITDIASALEKDEYVIEIVVPRESVSLVSPMNNPLHYVLTYWKNGTLYTLDPARGKEEPRQNFIDGTTAKWNFCNGGIFLKPSFSDTEVGEN